MGDNAKAMMTCTSSLRTDSGVKIVKKPYHNKMEFLQLYHQSENDANKALQKHKYIGKGLTFHFNYWLLCSHLVAAVHSLAN